MPIELFQNNATTNLSSGINSSTTTIPVLSTAGFSTAVNGASEFRLAIDQELMIVNTTGSGQFTNVTRGAEGTTAAAHSSGAGVYEVLTAASLPRNNPQYLISGQQLFNASDSLLYSNGATFVDNSNNLYYADGANPIADNSNTLYYGNGNPLADAMGNLDYSPGGPLADVNGTLFYSSGNILADVGSNLYYGSGVVLSDVSGTLYYGTGQILGYNTGNLNVVAQLLDGTASAGSSGQFFSSTGTATAWAFVTPSSVGIVRGGFTATGTATTSFNVSIGSTQANTSYRIAIEPTNLLSAAVQYVSAKTTTVFTVTYLAGLTGAVAFDWILVP